MVKTILSTSVIFFAIAAVRKCFREKAGNVFLYSLWLLFAAGLVMPVFSAVLQDAVKWENRLESPVSIMNLVKKSSLRTDQADYFVQPVEKNAENGAGSVKPEGETGTKAFEGRKAVETAQKNVFLKGAESRQLREVLFFIWAAGAAVILLCQLVSERLFRRQLTENRKLMDYCGQKVYVVNGIKTPLLFRGRGLSSEIYLPEMIIGNETLVRYAVLHENIHRKHGDIWWGYLRNILTALYWFDPLVWAAAVLSKRDCEYACDSSVMKNMSRKECISYGNSLLSLIQAGGNGDLFSTATAMKMRKSEMEVRIRMIRNGKKGSIFAAAFILALLSAAGTAAFTDAVETEQAPVQKNRQERSSGQPQQRKIPAAKRAEYKLTDIWGADPPYIYYEDDTRMIFAGSFGLFVYSRETEEIVSSLDLKEIGCHMTQGDQYCEICVSEDGKTVYLHVLNDKKMYQYSIETKELQHLEYKLPDKLYNRKKWEKKNQSGILCKGSTIGDLVYWYDDGGDLITYEPLFYRPYGSCRFFEPENIRDLKEVSFYADGKEYVITEENKLAWIEQRFSDSAQKLKGAPACPFYRMMYMKRKDGSCGKIFPATDSCAVYQSGDSFYDYQEKSNEDFWGLFGIEDMDAVR